ncbi:xylose isomerase [Vagococcus martis]|uniref:Xylose isomerase n=1 Tax=Vagococcus martis TaxID=1768210 RepID=A0A1V4DHK3_9ENTE|nr:TIM barrel protein [Vagococcus martis]OPF87953.1 xylose isomerase [Vagococcus martis]
MQESIHNYFDLGLIQWMSYPPQRYELLDTVTKVSRDPFFNAIEMTQIHDDKEREAARDLLAQSHMTVCYGAQPRLLGPGLNPNDLDEAKRLLAEKTLIEAVDEAEYLGAKGIAFLSGKWEEATKDEAYQQLLKTTRNVCSYAYKKGMMVELEVFDFDMDKCSLIGPAPLAAQFASDVRLTHSNFGLIMDLSHFPTTYETSKFAIQCTKPYITHLHIGNAVVKEGCEAYGDLHPRFGFPNSANDTAELLDFFQVLKQENILDCNNPMVLSFEVLPRPDEDADIIVANTKRVIERAWAQL